MINLTAPIHFWMTDKVMCDVCGLESLSLSKYHQGLIKICGAGGEKVDTHSGRGQLVSIKCKCFMIQQNLIGVCKVSFYIIMYYHNVSSKYVDYRIMTLLIILKPLLNIE